MPPPRKKDRLRGSLSPVWEQFPPTGTLCGGQSDLPGKSRPDEGSKTAPAKPEAVCRLRPWGKGGNGRCLVPGSTALGCPPGQRAYPAQKQSPARAGDCAQAAPWGNGRQWGVWCRESTALGTRRGRGHARAQKQPPAGPEAVWMRDMGVTCPGRSV